MFKEQLANVIRSGAAHSKKAAALVVAAPLALAGQAHAAIPTEVTAAIGDVETALTTAIGMVIAAMVVVWGLKKRGTKMGWF